MKIPACIKEIINPESHFKIDKKEWWVFLDNYSSYRLNYYDQFSLEQTFLLKD